MLVTVKRRGCVLVDEDRLATIVTVDRELARRWCSAGRDLECDPANVLTSGLAEDVIRAGTPACLEVDEVGVVARGFDLVEAVAER